MRSRPTFGGFYILTLLPQRGLDATFRCDRKYIDAEEGERKTEKEIERGEKGDVRDRSPVGYELTYSTSGIYLPTTLTRALSGGRCPFFGNCLARHGGGRESLSRAKFPTASRARAPLASSSSSSSPFPPLPPARSRFRTRNFLDRGTRRSLPTRRPLIFAGSDASSRDTNLLI